MINAYFCKKCYISFFNAETRCKADVYVLYCEKFERNYIICKNIFQNECLRGLGQEEGRIIDVHAHILPGVDDGARDMDEALKMLKCAASQGIRAVIATPHYSRRRGVSGLESLLDALQESIRKEYPDFVLYPGQETYYHKELAECLNQGKALTMAGSRYVLVEFDPGVSYEYLFRGIRSLLYAGYFPVLAHVERYGCLYREERFAELNDAGCVYQMNYNSLEGRAEVRSQTFWKYKLS